MWPLRDLSNPQILWFYDFLNKTLPSGGPDSARYQDTFHQSQLAPLSSNFYQVCKGFNEFGGRRSSFERQVPHTEHRILAVMGQIIFGALAVFCKDQNLGLPNYWVVIKANSFSLVFSVPDDGGVWLYRWLGLTEEKICVEKRTTGVLSLCSWSSSLYQGMDVWKMWGTKRTHLH